MPLFKHFTSIPYVYIKQKANERGFRYFLQLCMSVLCTCSSVPNQRLGINELLIRKRYCTSESRMRRPNMPLNGTVKLAQTDVLRRCIRGSRRNRISQPTFQVSVCQVARHTTNDINPVPVTEEQGITF